MTCRDASRRFSRRKRLKSYSRTGGAQVGENLGRLERARVREVIVVGDTHGQYHDVLRLLQIAGEPCETRAYVFNGDFVDRGGGRGGFALVIGQQGGRAGAVKLLRGNHETEFCTECYGFERELSVKYGKTAGRRLYVLFLEVCAELPLACVVGDATLVLHGGCFGVRV